MSEIYNPECFNCRHDHYEGSNMEACLAEGHNGEMFPAPCADYDPICSHCQQSLKPSRDGIVESFDTALDNDGKFLLFKLVLLFRHQNGTYSRHTYDLNRENFTDDHLPMGDVEIETGNIADLEKKS
jgi:hypothetical protein